MEDLDLDELDQAVTKIMDKPKGKRAVKRPADSPAAAMPASSPSDSVTVTSMTSPTPEPKPEPKEEPSMSEPRQPEPTRVTVNRPMPRVPERKRTHFGAMDIIQPASSKVSAPSGRAGRVATTLTPTQEITPEPIEAPKPELIAPVVPEPSVQEKPAEATHNDVSDEVLASLSMLDEPKVPKITDEPPKSRPLDTAKTGDGWPDPLDFHDFSGTPAKKPEPTPTDPLIDELKEESKEAPPSMDAEPVSVADEHQDAALGSSPFLTTKVEKRPLGAYANTAPEPQKTDLPETDNQVPHESTSKSEMAEASLESKQHLADEPEDMDSLRQMAIPQQYHTAPQHPKEGVHNVFDTKEYHAAPQNMRTAHKGNPGLVIGVVVLIVLIIAAVLVGYFMMTGTFDVTKLW